MYLQRDYSIRVGVMKQKYLRMEIRINKKLRRDIATIT